MGREGFTWFVGVVETTSDPLETGRVRVRARTFIQRTRQIPHTTDLPWASVMLPVTSPAVSGVGHTPFLLEGSWVVGFFRDVDCQEPVIMGSLPGNFQQSVEQIRTKHSTIQPGISEWKPSNQISTKLARGTQTHTYTPDSTISEPADPYNAVYPHNKVYATKSHIREYDDTINAERIRERHKLITFYQIHPNGDKITHVVNDNYTVIVRIKTVYT